MSNADRIAEWLPILWFLLAFVILTLLWTSGTLSRLLERVTSVGGFGLSFEFTEKSARETRDSIEKGLGEIRTAIRRKLAADVRATGLQEALASVIQDTSLAGKKGYRTTIHIPDPLFENQLYQLLDYHPMGGGAGRTFSTRSGIIGIAWRNLRSDKWHQESNVIQDDLRRIWGMTETEARARETTDRKKLFLAVPLFDLARAVPIGVFYFDTDKREEFGLPPSPEEDAPETQCDEAKEAADGFLDRIEAEVTAAFELKMAKPLSTLVEAAKKESPQLQLESV